MDRSVLGSTSPPKISLPTCVFNSSVIPMVQGQGEGWFLVSFRGYPIGEFFESPNKGRQKGLKKARVQVLGSLEEKVKQLINQKERGYLTCGEIDGLLR